MAHHCLDEERVRELVVREARRMELSRSAVEPIVGVISMQWYTHGHFNYFYVNARRTELLKDPVALPTKCLYESLSIIKKNPRYYLIMPAGDVDESQEALEVQYEVNNEDLSNE